MAGDSPSTSHRQCAAAASEACYCRRWLATQHRLMSSANYKFSIFHMRVRVSFSNAAKSSCLFQLPRHLASNAISCFLMCLPLYTRNLKSEDDNKAKIMALMKDLLVSNSLDEATYRAAFLVMRDCGCLQDEVLDVFGMMRRARILPNSITMGLYSRVIAGSKRRSDVVGGDADYDADYDNNEEDYDAADYGVHVNDNDRVASTCTKASTLAPVSISPPFGTRPPVQKFHMWSRCTQCSNCHYVFLDEVSFKSSRVESRIESNRIEE